jgi:hypothetical protein
MRGCKISLMMLALALAACAPRPSDLASSQANSNYPLPVCDSNPGPRTEANCRIALFPQGADIGKRDPDDFPGRYLELFEPDVRYEYCATRAAAEPGCGTRLKKLSEYFNPSGRPGNDEIGVALEGGGTKSAAFGLGVLAGLQHSGALASKVTAISSISGGSYAASFYYNRWYDRLRDQTDQDTIADWFRSCVPSYFILHHIYQLIQSDVLPYACGEKTAKSGHIENSVPVPDQEFFDRRYRYIGHVWTNHDLLGGNTPGNLTTKEDLGIGVISHAAEMIGESLLSAPIQFVARTLFRWPVNTAPSKLSYKLGLEREYGYSPGDWAAAGSTDVQHLATTLSARCGQRTLKNLGAMVKSATAQGAKTERIPRWIIGSTAPANLGPMDWLFPQPSDPLRLQFELTWDGYGSGVYGYALQAPENFLEFCAQKPDGLPIVSAVVASAAFFDDDQAAVSSEPERLGINALLHFTNVTWFTDLRNYNVDDQVRDLNTVLPYPAYLAQSARWNETPYIHLQDGGNTENTGIMPLLRRGYKTIIYAHGDNTPQWGSICHLKNQLELDGTYSLVSPSLEAAMKGHRHQITAASTSGNWGRPFRSFLDGLCATELDGSDLATFDLNAARDATDMPDDAVARLYCRRLLGASGHDAVPCDEYVAKFNRSKSEYIPGWVTRASYDWPSDRVVTFELHHAGREHTEKQLSTIIAIVPGISFSDFQAQVTPKASEQGVTGWNEWCSDKATSLRKMTTITQCIGPDARPLGSPNSTRPGTALPCIALAHLIEDQCMNLGGKQVPDFPQESFFFETLHTSYTSYAAYFDLARNQVENIVCNYAAGRVVTSDRCAKRFDISER